jgi:hypothetical protein
MAEMIAGEDNLRILRLIMDGKCIMGIQAVSPDSVVHEDKEDLDHSF